MKHQNVSEEYYDDYVNRQLKMGVNHRHYAINALLLKHGLKSHDNVLEIGAGIGTITGFIAQKVKHGSVTATDISGKSLEVAKKRLQKFSTISYLKGDVTDLDFNEKFDVIVLPDVLEHIPIAHHTDLFEKLYQILKENGWIFIHIPNPFYLDWVTKNQPELLQEIDQPLSLNHLVNVFDTTGFFVQHLDNYSVYVEENDYQALVLKKVDIKTTFTTLPIKNPSITKRIVNKAKRIIKRQQF